MKRIRKTGKQERLTVLCSCVLAFLIQSSGSASEPVLIGSKKFTESYVLGEIAKRTLSDSGISTEHRQGMGGTIILWEAIRAAQIHVYPEYTGTIAEEILKDRPSNSREKMRAELANAM